MYVSHIEFQQNQAEFLWATWCSPFIASRKVV